MADKKGAAQAQKGFSSETEEARKKITKKGMSEEEKASLEVLLATMPMGAALKAVKAAKKALTPASKTIRKRAKADKVRKKESESRSKTRQKEADKRTKRIKKESQGKKKASEKRHNKRIAARKREREGMSDAEKIALATVATVGGAATIPTMLIDDPLSMGERNKRIAEEKKKAITEHGGYANKYAKGGSVKKSWNY